MPAPCGHRRLLTVESFFFYAGFAPPIIQAEPCWDGGLELTACPRGMGRHGAGVGWS